MPRCERALVAVSIMWSALLTVSCAQAAAPAGADVTLVDLDDAGAVASWTTVNDPVMGGRSTSSVAFGNGGLRNCHF